MPDDANDDYGLDDLDLDDAELLAELVKLEKSYAPSQTPAPVAGPSRLPAAAQSQSARRAATAAQPKKPAPTRPVAVSTKPVYEDDFPNVIPSADGTYKKWIDPKDLERAELQKQLDEVH